jgi:tRNA C32,U32 (ribose-2'-O)-methylase TrmJ
VEDNKEKKETEKKIWKSIIGKSFISKREALGLMRFFRKVKDKNNH